MLALCASNRLPHRLAVFLILRPSNPDSILQNRGQCSNYALVLNAVSAGSCKLNALTSVIGTAIRHCRFHAIIPWRFGSLHLALGRQIPIGTDGTSETRPRIGTLRLHPSCQAIVRFRLQGLRFVTLGTRFFSVETVLSITVILSKLGPSLRPACGLVGHQLSPIRLSKIGLPDPDLP
jgi:hypothetical protein